MVLFHILATLRDAPFAETIAVHLVTIVVQNELDCLHSQS